MERYDELVTRVYDKLDGKNIYPDEEKYHDFFINNTEYERLNEHNLWTYWQGRNVRNPKIDIVNITLHFFLKDVRPMQHPVMNHSIAVA